MLSVWIADSMNNKNMALLLIWNQLQTKIQVATYIVSMNLSHCFTDSACRIVHEFTYREAMSYEHIYSNPFTNVYIHKIKGQVGIWSKN